MGDMILLLLGIISVTGGQEFIDLSLTIDETQTYPIYIALNLTNTRNNSVNDKVTIFTNNIQMAEHHSTHVDAPRHWCSKGSFVHELPLEKLWGPGIQLDFSKEGAANKDFNLTIQHILDWEGANGKIPEGAIVILNFGWNQYFGDLKKSLNSNNLSDSTSFHWPGITNQLAVFLAKERKVLALGSDTPTPPTPVEIFNVHESMLCDYGVLLLENVGNVAALPATGTTIFISALKLRNAGASPVRLFAVKGVIGSVAGAASSSVDITLLIIFCAFASLKLHLLG